jgi:hypothetical protein
MRWRWLAGVHRDQQAEARSGRRVHASPTQEGTIPDSRVRGCRASTVLGLSYRSFQLRP